MTRDEKKQKWALLNYPGEYAQLGRVLGVDPLVIKLIYNKGIQTEEGIREYLSGGIESLHDPSLLMNVDKACALLQKAIRQKQRIRIVGDYDIDGVMSSYILLSALQRLGADVDVRIPERIRDGYGLNERFVTEAIRERKDLLLTCDNGIAAYAEIALAKEKGLRVIVTDHHDIPFRIVDGKREDVLPPADALIDPKQPGEIYPFHDLCGAAVAWKLMQRLYHLEGREEREIDDWISYVAIATIGDVMLLQGENRILVREGLRALKDLDNPGLLQLIAQQNLEKEKIDVYHVGFVIGPCLNAGGRLDTALRALHLLTERDRSRAAKLAGDLIALNTSRKAMTEQGVEEAIRQIEGTELMKDKVLVIFLPELHESIAGIVAGRIKEKYHKPCFVLTKAANVRQGEASSEKETREAEQETPALAKGSGRSIPAYPMSEELGKVQKLLVKYGGHPMAAGLTIEERNIDSFRQALNDNTRLTREDLIEEILVDALLPMSYLTAERVHAIDRMKPFGNGNKKPLFARLGVRVPDRRLVGKMKNVLRCTLLDPDGTRMTAVRFGDGAKLSAFLEMHDRIDILYIPVINAFGGREKVELRIEGYRASTASSKPSGKSVKS